MSWGSCCSDSRRLGCSDASGPASSVLDWTARVCCVTLHRNIGKPCFDSGNNFHDVQINGQVVQVMRQEGTVQSVLGRLRNVGVTAFVHYRQKWSDWQLWTPPLLYHAFVLMETDNDLVICTEKYNDKLELMLGDARLMGAFALKFRATGDERQHSSAKMKRVELSSAVQVGHFVDWIDGPLAMVWKPYSLLWANCQHYAHDLERMLRNPKEIARLSEDRELVVQAVRRDGKKLRFAAESCRADPDIVTAAVSNQWRAFAFAGDELKQDREFVSVMMSVSDGHAFEFAGAALKRDPGFVLEAVRATDGQALEFAAAELRQDQDFVHIAISSTEGRALEFAADELKHDRRFVLEALRRYSGRALEFAAMELKHDRSFVLEAVRATYGHALVFAAAELRHDPEFVLEATQLMATRLCALLPT